MASSSTAQIATIPAGAVPVEYLVPDAQEFGLLVVRASFDGTAAGAAFVPVVEVYSPANKLMMRATADQVKAGGSADVTFAPFLGKTAGGGCCSSSGADYQQIIADLAPRAFWPFDETSGAVAADTTGNGWDLAVSNVGAPGPGTWAWAQPAPDPWTSAPLVTGGGPQATNVPFPTFVDNFAVAAWVNVANQFQTEPAIMRQGDPYASIGGGGWTLHMASATGKFYALWSDGVAYHSVTADALSATNTWHLVGFQKAGGVGQLWLDGVQQSATDSGTIKSATGIAFARANAGGFFLRGYLRDGLAIDRPLTAGEWAALAVPGGNVPAGWLLTATGAGSSSYSPLSSGSAPAGYRLTADGVGGTYWAP